MKKLTGQLSAQEEQELETLVQNDVQCRRLVNRLLSPEFLQKAILDRNSRSLSAVWQSLYGRMKYTGGLFRHVRRYARYVATVAAIFLLIMGWSVWHQHEETTNVVIYPGTTQAEICWPDGRQDLLTTDMLAGKLSFAAQAFEDSVRAVPLSPDLYTRIAVPQGSEYKVRLDDGTLVHLNAGSTLIVPTDFSACNRQVNLSGEAYLEVAKDSLHPFRIDTEKAQIFVLGTKLNVRCYDDEPCLDVVLETGRVDLRTMKQTASLPVGYKATVDGRGGVVVTPADVYVETAWHHGRFVFDNQSMEYIMRELGRWYDVQASFSSDEARKVRFTLDFDRYDTFNRFMDIVRMIGEVNIILENENQVLISQKKH